MLEYDYPPITAWSISRLRNFETCAYRVALESAEKREKPPQPDDGPLQRGIRVHGVAEAYVKGETDELIEELSKSKVVEVLEFYRACYAEGKAIVEEDWGHRNDWSVTGFWDDDVWLRLKLDAATFLDEGKTAALITDYKTGKSWGKEVKSYEQGAIYTIAMMFRNPTLMNVECNFLYTDENKIKPFKFTRLQMPPLIKRFTQRALRLTLCTRFEPKPNRGNCMYCPFGPNEQGNNACPHGIPK
jgi:hypothetical protein